MRLTLFLAVAAGAFVLAAPAGAQSYQQDRRACLHGPFDYERVVRQCTAVLEAGHLTPLERAIALNNRAIGRGSADPPDIRDLTEAISLAPTIATLFYNRGLKQSDDPARAIPDYDQAIRLDPRYAVAWAGRGEVFVEQKQYARAIRDFTEAIRLAPTYMHPMYNPYESRARAKEAMGDVKGAEADRKLYMPLWIRADKVRPGPNVSGRRSWEGWLTK